VSLSAENRRKMIAGLLGEDEYLQSTILGSLDWLGTPDAMLTTAPPIEEESIEPVAADAPAPPRQPTAPPLPAETTPDIAVVSVLPWWFLLGGGALCLVLAWLMRGVSISRWVMLAITLLGGLLLLYSWLRAQSGALSPARFRARRRLAASLLGAGACGFAIVVALPMGDVLIDNLSGTNVRIFVDDTEWLTMPTGESKRQALARGKHRIKIQAVDGNHVFDAHDIEVADYGPYVLNVLGGQRYFQGGMLYGGGGGVDMKIVKEKWFALPTVDYLFRDPPDTIVARNPVRKTFFTKGAPPKFRGEERE
jgi:hypothetical protein